MKKVSIIIITMAICSFAAKAQKISNTQFEQKGNSIVVSYTLSELDIDKSAFIDLYVSTNGGKNFNGPLKSVAGDVGLVSTVGSKNISWKVFEEYSDLEGDIVFEVRATIKNKPVQAENLVAYNISGTSFIGLTYARVGRWGWYARVKTSGSSASSDYTTTNTMIPDYDGDGYYKYTDKTKRSRMGITVGVMHRLNRNYYLYAGGGFGSRKLVWNAEEFSYTDNSKIGEIWAEHEDKSASGPEIEFGIIRRLGRFNISLGANAVNFKFFEVNGGIGLFF